MKKTFKSLIVITLLFITNSVLGAEPKVTVDVARKNIVIELDKPKVEYQIRFIDMESQVIYSNDINKNEVHGKKLNLSKLSVGKYILMVENYLKTHEFLISVDASSVNIISENVEHKPQYRKQDDMVYLNLLNLNSNPIYVELKNSFDDIIYSEIMEDLDVSKAFNFKDSFKGVYTIVVKDGAKVYSKEIEVK